VLPTPPACRSAARLQHSTSTAEWCVVSDLTSSTGRQPHIPAPGPDPHITARLAVVAKAQTARSSHHRRYRTTARRPHRHVTSSQPASARLSSISPHKADGAAAYLDGYELVLTARMRRRKRCWHGTTQLSAISAETLWRPRRRLHQRRQRSCYPLRLKRAPDITFPHTVLIGNAAQTLHRWPDKVSTWHPRCLGVGASHPRQRAGQHRLGRDVRRVPQVAPHRPQRRHPFHRWLVRLFSNDMRCSPCTLCCTHAAGLHPPRKSSWRSG